MKQLFNNNTNQFGFIPPPPPPFLPKRDEVRQRLQTAVVDRNSLALAVGDSVSLLVSGGQSTTLTQTS